MSSSVHREHLIGRKKCTETLTLHSLCKLVTFWKKSSCNHHKGHFTSSLLSPVLKAQSFLFHLVFLFNFDDYGRHLRFDQARILESIEVLIGDNGTQGTGTKEQEVF